MQPFYFDIDVDLRSSRQCMAIDSTHEAVSVGWGLRKLHESRKREFKRWIQGVWGRGKIEETGETPAWFY